MMTVAAFQIRLLNLKAKFQNGLPKYLFLVILYGVSLVVVFYLTSLPMQWAILGFLACLFIFVVIISRHLRNLLLAVILFDVPFQLDVHLGYRRDIADIGGVEGWNISVTTIALVILYASWFLGALAKRGKKQKRHLLQDSWPLSLYVCFSLLSIIVAHDFQLALFQNFLIFQLFLLYIYIIGTVQSRKDVLSIMTVLVIGLALEGAIIIALRNYGQTIEIAGLTARVDKGLRIGGTIGGPNTAGGYLSLMLIPAMSLVLAHVNKFTKWLGIFAFCLGFIAIAFTLSRGAWAAFIISTVIFILVSWSRGWLPLKVPMVLVMMGVALLYFWHEVFAIRIFGQDGGSFYSRIPLMKLALKIISDNFFLGIGANNFSTVMTKYITSEFYGIWLHTVHNKYLLVWVEMGIGGFLAFILFLLTSIRKGWKCWQLQDPLLAPLGLGITAAIVGHMVHMNFDTFQNRGTIQLLWIGSALITAMYNILRAEMTDSQENMQEGPTEEE